MVKNFRVTEIRDNSGHEHEFIGTIEGEVMGRAELIIEGKEAEFRIHLLPEYQNKGYGYELTKHAVKEGQKYLDYIWLGFEEGNEPAKRIYEKAGFRYETYRMGIKKCFPITKEKMKCIEWG